MIKKYLLVFLVVPFAFIFLICCDPHPSCQIDTTKPQTMSVQNTDFIGSEILDNEDRCPPKKIFLRVASNSKSQNRSRINAKDNKKAPSITTLITYPRDSSEDKKNDFHIVRIDQIKREWYYSKDESCFAWKWSNNNKEQVLTLSMERNLQIHSPNIERIVFIILMPLSLIDKEPEILLQPYTWNESSGFRIFKIRENPNLKEILGLTNKPSEKLGNDLNPGVPVIQNAIGELRKIDEQGGVHIDKDINPLVMKQKAKGYNPTSEKVYCAIPPDL